MSLTEHATYLAYAGGWQAVRWMPERVAYGLFDRLADQQWRSHSAGVGRLEANLARVLGPVGAEELRAASRAGMRSYMRYWCDAFRLPGWDSARIDSFDLRHGDRLTDSLSVGRGVVIALPHMGNWDHAGAYVSRKVSQVHAVAERLEPEQLFEAFVEYRTALGMRIHGLGDPGVYQALREEAAAGGLIALLADRDLSARGIDVTFFGQAARFPAGPAALAVDTGAALHPASLFWTGRNVADILPEVVPPSDGDRAERIRATTQGMADVFQRAIAEHPTDWHMLQRLWLADLDPRRLAARDAADRDQGEP
ncbi:MAG: phosphatidylinositol mannoside acyltransferase [Candidatus Nanopelagicales bacterium]